MLITNVTGNYFLKQNDTATEMHLAVIEVDGTPVDLSTATRVEVVIGTIEGRMLTKTPTLLSAPGELTFGLDEGDLLPPGDSLLEIHIITEQNERRVAPSKGHYKLRVQAPIGALGLTVTTYTLEYFLGEVNRILFGLPQLLERGNALADRMDDLIDESEQTLDVMNTTIEESRTATTESIGATIASELATQAAQQATTEAEQATVNTIQATVDAENATTDSLDQTQLSITATQAANDATLRATTQADRAEDAADDAISATADAIQATQNANDATGRANTAASRADTATSNANNATDAANTATTEANEARDNANIAASLADGIATDLLGYNSPISNFSLATRYIKHQHVRSNGSTYRAKVETQGNPLPVEPATSNAWFDLVSKKGDKGDAGTSLKPLGVKNDVSELPLTGNEPGDAYLVGQNMYMWDDGQWNDAGPIVGPQGEQGVQGDIGTGIEYVWDGTRLGVKREDEASFSYRELKGAKGDKGDNAKIISLDFVIPATDALQFNGNLITIRDYMYDPAADSLQVYQNSRILYPGEDFELENGNIRLASTIADPASTTFYVQVTRSVFDIDEEQSHATVVGALGYTPARSEDITQVAYDLEEADTRLTTQLAQIAVNINNFGAIPGDNLPDHEAIQQAIDYANALGGGEVFVPLGKYDISSNIHVKENVRLKFQKGARIAVSGNYSVILYKNSQLIEPNLVYTADYNGVGILLHTDYINDANNVDKSSGAKILIENPRMYKPFSSTSESIAMNLVADTSGFWGVRVNSGYIRGFKKIVKISTVGTGWVNGNDFDGITTHECVNVVHIEKGTESAGVDYNSFVNLKIQTTDHMRDIFIDNTTGNNYLDNEIWDMKTYKDARVGNVISQRTKNGQSISKQQYTHQLLVGTYYLLGRFSKATHASDRVVLKASSYTYYNTDFLITGTGLVQIMTYGRDTHDDKFKFYLRDIGNGQKELYLAVTGGLEVTLHYESMVRFNPTPLVYYSSVDNLVEITSIGKRIGNIYDSGTNFIQYTDGRMKCWGRYEAPAVRLITDDAVTGIKMMEGGPVTYAKPFVSNPNINATSMRDFSPISVGVSSPTVTGFIPRLYSNMVSTTYSHIFYWEAEGFWK